MGSREDDDYWNDKYAECPGGGVWDDDLEAYWCVDCDEYHEES